jgi:hypothetical protein
MADPKTITVGVEQITGILRDGSLVISICVFGWKVRSYAQKGVEFFERLNRHMDVVEDGLATMMGNHLPHIQHDLKKISGRESDDLDMGI